MLTWHRYGLRVLCMAVLGGAILGAVSAEAGGDDRDLLRAAKSNAEPTVVRAALKAGADVNTRGLDNATALLWAVQWNNVATARLLISAGATVDAANDYGVTPLAMACTNGSVATVTLLLDAGANPNLPNPLGVTPLMIAARGGNVDVVAILLAHHADVGAKENVLGQTPLMWAIEARQNSVARVLLDAGADPRAKATSGFTPLMFAARQGDIPQARELMARGVDVNEASSDGLTALHVSTVRGHVPMALFLLDSGANPNAAGPGYTPLHWASWRSETALTVDYSLEGAQDGEWGALEGIPDRQSKLTLIKALVQKGADVNSRTSKELPAFGGRASMGGGGYSGATPFFLAAHVSDVEVMRLLLALGANPLIGSKDETTPLMVAAGQAIGQEPEQSVKEEARLESVTLCLNLGADVNTASKNGRTALHASARYGLNRVVQLLVDHGAHLQPKDEKGLTPMKLAAEDVVTGGMMAYFHPATASLLRQLGATE